MKTSSAATATTKVRRASWFDLLCMLTVPVLLGGCPMNQVVWLEPSATRDHLVVLRGSKRGVPEALPLAGFDVRECGLEGNQDGPEALWAVRLDLSARPVKYPSRIVYGTVPEGYVSAAPAKPIKGSCVRLVGAGATVTVVFDLLGQATTREDQ